MLSKTSLKILTVLFLNLAILLLASNFSLAEVPKFINYQGKLTNKNGIPLNGTYTMTFTIYDDETGGSTLWTETQTSVSVNKGIFNVILGSGSDGVPDTGDDVPITADVFYNSQRWLGVTVGSDSEMTPRARFTSVPYAIRAEKAEDANTVAGVGVSTTPSPNKLLPLDSNAKLPLSVVLKVYDSGWFYVTTNTSYTKVHNLGTTKFIPFVWFSTSPSGTNPILTNWDMTLSHLQGAADRNQGYTMYNVTSTQLTIFTGEMALAVIFTGGNSRIWHNSGYYRVLAIALE